MSNKSRSDGRGLPELLTVRDVQDITQLGRTKVYELIRDGELPIIRLGRSIRIRRRVFEEWLVAHEDDFMTLRSGSR